LAQNPNYEGFFAGLRLYPGMELVGATRGVTTLKAAGGLANNTSQTLVQNHHLDAATPDTHMLIENLTIDGNAARQTNPYDNHLLTLQPTPVVALDRAIAVGGAPRRRGRARSSRRARPRGVLLLPRRPR
jgi:hypothetical protein